MSPEDRVLLFLPLTHNFGQNAAMHTCFDAGATLFLQSEFDVEQTIRILSEQKITVLFGVPTIYRILYERATRSELASLRRCISAAATMPAELADKWEEKFGIGISDGYGLSETSLNCYNHFYKPRPGAVGWPLEQVEVRVVDDEGRKVATGIRGEVAVRGPNVMLGYWNRPAETAQVLREGWFYTGDIGHMDADGYLYIVDRLKDMVNVAGQKVYPSAVEGLLERHPAVSEVAVYGLPDALLGERLCAGVVLRPEATATAEELQHFCRQHSAEFKVPADIVFLDALPKSRTGKVLKRVLRDRHCQREESTPHSVAIPGPSAPPTADAALPAAAAIESWLVAWLRRAMHLDATVIDPERALFSYGVTSLLASRLAIDLARWLGQPVEAALLWKLPTIRATAQQLAETASRGGSLPSQPAAPLLLSELPADAQRDQPDDASHLLPQRLARVERQQGRQVLVDGRWRCDFASCNYLGLDLDPRVIAELTTAVQEWGVHPSWSREVASPTIYEELERELAELIGAPHTLVFPSLQLLHLGVIPLLVGSDGIIFKDSAAHQTMYEACCRAQSTGAGLVEYRHNDLHHLEQLLRRYPASATKLVILDGVYSMSGVTPPILDYVRLARAYGALLYVDDAHGFGITGADPTPDMPYGVGGGGLLRHHGIDPATAPIVYVAGLSKSFSSYAAFIACPNSATKHRYTKASTFSFSGPSPIASLASAISGLRLNRLEGDVWRRKLHALVCRLADGARALGFAVKSNNSLPIVAVAIGATDDVVRACQLLWKYDILITPAVYPLVPKGQGVLRFSVTAANTEAEIDQALRALDAVRSLLTLPEPASLLAH
jgi:7-keto-8-aminopelargonate synthetase-like enzyme/acyl carrier protein